MALDDRARQIQDCLDRRRKSIRWLARRIGKNHQSVRLWLLGENAPRDEAIWATMLAVACYETAPQSGPPAHAIVRETSTGLMPVRAGAMVRLPMLGAASAGDGMTHGDPDERGFLVPDVFAFPDYAAAFIDGDSMMPLLQPGDFAVFRDSPHPRPGLVYAIHANGSLLVKQLVFTHGRWEMRSTNAAYPPEPLPPDHRILGYLVGYYRSTDEQLIRHKRTGITLDHEVT